MKKMILGSVVALAAIAFTGSAIAQTNANPNVNANNLVSVNISNVAQNIANDLNVDVQDVIDVGAVQVPIGVAATVCNVQANAGVGQQGRWRSLRRVHKFRGPQPDCSAQFERWVIGASLR